jgi:hypothetical protein
VLVEALAGAEPVLGSVDVKALRAIRFDAQP